jgi:hypothetical protein
MTKQSGLGDNFYLGSYNLSGDVNSLGRIGGGPAALDLTGIDKSAYERVGGQRDGGIDWVSYFNKAAGQAHAALSTLPRTSRIASYFRGTTLGNPAASQVCKQIDYNPNRAQDGALTIAVSTQATDFGLQWGKSLTAGLRTDTAATDGTGVDFGTGSTAFGAQFFLHVTEFTGTDVTIKIQSSSDDGAGDAFADVTGGGFTLVAGVTEERIATAGDATIERYLRVVTSGTFDSVTFAVVAVRNDTAVVF